MTSAGQENQNGQIQWKGNSLLLPVLQPREQCTNISRNIFKQREGLDIFPYSSRQTMADSLFLHVFVSFFNVILLHSMNCYILACTSPVSKSHTNYKGMKEIDCFSFLTIIFKNLSNFYY